MIIALILMLAGIGGFSASPAVTEGGDASAIVGTWEFVEVTGSDPWALSLSEALQGLMETFYPDGTGLSFFVDDLGEHSSSICFTWAVRDNLLIMDMQWDEHWDMGETIPLIFSVSDSKLIMYSEYISDYHYPDGQWVFRRVE
ncbi:MAG: hypothetical protein LBE55_05160 [Clostridiales bacterium]|jgi:hypothetical protein|nr:hypothetical protein [Clostridiales bacterium]